MKSLDTTYTFSAAYADIDRMGYLYYGQYARYLELARVALFKSIGISYDEIEKQGVWLPILDFSIQYVKPILYDIEMEIKVKIQKKPLVKMQILYEIFDKNQVLYTTAETTLFYFNPKRNKPQRIPEFLKILVDPYFE